ncbi:sodium/potassium-transporting ATPase subunit beta-1-like [Tribolium madens]|uniref:sodium/potassium-transporting ATPase subunit beta-1-like n=1 Tax=Tribolium madens TaxID=41895 RepID=UPI001CF73EE6|nr:sodium/potassium-transporting ATPase subunit beta-1-like [Tribolium madens]
MTTKNSKPKVQEFQFHSVPKTTKWESFQRVIYDPSKNEYFGRTGKSWYQLLIFYSIFYTCLAALVAICMKGLTATLNDKEPKWKLEESLIGTNPGLGFRPISNNTLEGSLIWYNLRQPETTQKWVQLVDEFLQPYRVPQIGQNYQHCDYEIPVKEGHVCAVEVDKFGPCTAENNYGFNSTSPCVFLKLNRIFGWVPDYIEHPENDMPDDLKQTITSSDENQVWISCAGENSFDREHVIGFNYFPSRGFPGYYYPYTNNDNYLSPLIAVQISLKTNVIVNIECRAWAKNIVYNGANNYRQGSVHFEIMVDSKNN